MFVTVKLAHKNITSETFLGQNLAITIGVAKISYLPYKATLNCTNVKSVECCKHFWLSVYKLLHWPNNPENQFPNVLQSMYLP